MKISEQLNYGVKIVNDKIVYVIKLKDGTYVTGDAFDHNDFIKLQMILIMVSLMQILIRINKK